MDEASPELFVWTALSSPAPQTEKEKHRGCGAFLFEIIGQNYNSLILVFGALNIKNNTGKTFSRLGQRRYKRKFFAAMHSSASYAHTLYTWNTRLRYLSSI
jgi:hypothetical protein